MFKNFTYRILKINIGKPMEFDEYKNQKSDREILKSLSKKVMDEMIRLTNEEI